MDRTATKVDVTIYRGALDAIFDECDRYDADETGGRLIGKYRAGFRGRLSIVVSGVIEPGPSARRSSTSFFQDGRYQEAVFRRIEQSHPEIEHLGNWHTHHVNGYPTLSGGDRETYHRIVNHEGHNTNFFYALLVTARNSVGSAQRYDVKHFIIRRDDAAEYEIPASKVKVVDRPLIWPAPASPDAATYSPNRSTGTSHVERAADSDFFRRVYPGLRPFLSKATGAVYWRGHIGLVDKSEAEIVVTEVEQDHETRYDIVVTDERAASMVAARTVSDHRFPSAREAVIFLERELNGELYRNLTTR